MLNIIKVLNKEKAGESVTEFYDNSTGELIGINQIKWNKWLIYAEDDHLILVSSSKVRTRDYYKFPRVNGNIYLRNTSKQAYAYFRKKEYEEFLKKWNLDGLKPLCKLNSNQNPIRLIDNEEIYLVKKKHEYYTTKYIYTDVDLSYLDLAFENNNIKFE
ncbi:hypothetical protein KQI77_00975 [Clostridium sp. MSJ-8]|uniref:hypothetical protein n=1 Tax=Clostridium sp. MSJ-8 TaxID=2841510 RepID=UPI001C0ED32B|nr:hypothetical protein [Clostridium sp. MSJ-8]MBU5486740.1 hypothetical protein [Clostridium sp. MSJ-8]